MCGSARKPSPKLFTTITLRCITLPEHESGGDDLAGHVGELELRGLEVRDALLELLTLL